MFNYLKPPYSTSLVREIIWQRLIEYGQTGCPVGDFLTAVLENNLKEAVLRADRENLLEIHTIVMFCYNELPGPCWGSPEKVKEWRSRDHD